MPYERVPSQAIGATSSRRDTARALDTAATVTAERTPTANNPPRL
ncbi:unannotated protein [freshwater metagenome]|uniref:Unannotated protein n=1 Tax=freshwater metagenome TaxID=449393 RepID=A0A6J7ECL4_9ZZZZ